MNYPWTQLIKRYFPLAIAVWGVVWSFVIFWDLFADSGHLGFFHTLPLLVSSLGASLAISAYLGLKRWSGESKVNIRDDGMSSVVQAEANLNEEFETMIHKLQGQNSGHIGSANVEKFVEKRTKELKEIRSEIVLMAQQSALVDFASGLAHEVSKPLKKMSEENEALSHGAEHGPVTKESLVAYLSLQDDRITDIQKILDGLRLYARETIEEPGVTVDAETIIDTMLGLCQSRLSSREIDLRMSPVPFHRKIHCRSQQIVQALLNLVINASEAVLTSENKWVSIDVNEDEENVYFSVTDSGPGVPDSIRGKIMLPFYSTKPRGMGAGMGLAIAKGIAEAHGGRLYLEVDSPHTKFVMRIPKSVAKESAA